MFKNVNLILVGLLAILATAVGGLAYFGQQPEAHAPVPIVSPELAKNNVCLLYLAGGELYHSALGHLAAEYSVTDYDVSTEGIVFTGSRYLGRDVGSYTDEEGNTVGWDSPVWESGVFLYDLTTRITVPLWLETSMDIQGTNGVSVSGDTIVFAANLYGPNTGGDTEIFSLNQNGEITMLTNNMEIDMEPDLMGDQLVWTTVANNNYALAHATIMAGGTLADQRILFDTNGGMAPTWSPLNPNVLTFDYYGDPAMYVLSGNLTALLVDGEMWSRYNVEGFDEDIFYFAGRVPGETITTGNFSRPSTFMEIWSWQDGQMESLIQMEQVDLTQPMQVTCSN